ncbi:MAG TPA: YkgJ family cysteine cluster protein [Pirellulaceae bacterium]|nr:YkgJ family cysteine cluster protein [Pirellulaceae bacterium]HMO91701.1 YkgJ family cysteine cluster protein [Pirellulaceae bacterium]HMP68398.1 YkgJ family cysteine cluster protein [Pirellulaceae bacterium]
MASQFRKPKRIVIKREDLPEGDCLCNHCDAKCCRYFALPIDRPKSIRDFEFIRWFILHDRVSLFVEDQTWYLMVHTPCTKLLPDNRCGIYQNRPTICHEYSTDDCEFEANFTFERYFETAEQIAEFCEAIFNKSPESKFRSPRPNPLPILA